MESVIQMVILFYLNILKNRLKSSNLIIFQITFKDDIANFHRMN
jgi:hypothetical protein